MNADAIRSLYVETLARAQFDHFCKIATWEEATESDRQTWIPNAERLVDALAAAGLLPTRRHTRFAVRGDEALIVEEFSTPPRQVSE